MPPLLCTEMPQIEFQKRNNLEPMHLSLGMFIVHHVFQFDVSRLMDMEKITI